VSSRRVRTSGAEPVRGGDTAPNCSLTRSGVSRATAQGAVPMLAPSELMCSPTRRIARPRDRHNGHREDGGDGCRPDNPCGRREEPSRAHSPRRACAPAHALGRRAMGCRLPGCVPLPRCGTHRRDLRGHGGGAPHARNRGGRRAGSLGVHNPHRGCVHVLHASDVLPCSALLSVSSDHPVGNTTDPDRCHGPHTRSLGLAHTSGVEPTMT
jgi:hypothetical protein